MWPVSTSLLLYVYHRGMFCVKLLKIVVCVSVLRFAVLFTLVSTNDSEHMMPRNACFGNIICQSCYQFYEQEQAYCVVGTAVSKVSNCTCLSQSLCVCFTYRQVIVKYSFVTFLWQATNVARTQKFSNLTSCSNLMCGWPCIVIQCG